MTMTETTDVPLVLAERDPAAVSTEKMKTCIWGCGKLMTPRAMASHGKVCPAKHAQQPEGDAVADRLRAAMATKLDEVSDALGAAMEVSSGSASDNLVDYIRRANGALDAYFTLRNVLEGSK
jgi:hypothetical protein